MSRRLVIQGGRQVRRKYVKARRPSRQYVARTVGPQAGESKYFDSSVSDFTVDETTTWVAGADVIKGTLAIPIQGTSVQTRVGRRIEIYKVSLRGTISMTTIAASATMLDPPAFRCILWTDTQTNGAVTTSASLMQAPGTATLPLKFSTFQNIANFGRFRVLKDLSFQGPDFISFNDAATTGTIASADIPIKIVHKFNKALVVKFSANGGDIGDVVDNSIYFTVIKSSGDGVHKISVQSRCYFKDK